MKDNNQNESGSSGLAIGICLGLAIGTAIAASTHNYGLWMPVGTALGVALGALYDRQRAGKGAAGGEDAEQPEDQED